MNKRTIASMFLAIMAISSWAQTRNAEFKPMTDSLSTLLKERTSVNVKLSLRSATRRGNTADLYFSDVLGDLPWRQEDVKWFRGVVSDLMPDSWKKYSVGRIFSRTQPLEDLVTPGLGNDGKARKTVYKVDDPKGTYKPIVRRNGGQTFRKGLTDRHIALWQSHGRYYETKLKRWEWQRSPNFMSVEDIYTQSYVLPFLIPMLENAGAYVMTPRERDPQENESVADNDPMFKEGRGAGVRTAGKYSESGRWEKAGTGFADAQAIYYGDENPFTMGTVRKADCVRGNSRKAEARWTPDIPERGEYAVYVSYMSLENSSTAAHYTVSHMGGETDFYVNQKMGGGTWIYLGTFEFDKGESGGVRLDNGLYDGAESGSVVTADGVRFGGGMGKIARGEEDEDYEYWTTSGLPAYLEGALYSMKWAGVDTTITRMYDTDYTNDYANRGAWVSLLSGGSVMNPKQEGKNIPFDLSMAWHTDAGVTDNDDIIGTLSIYTLLADDGRKLPIGQDRLACRELADLVQTQIVGDIRSEFNPDWTRRMLWDRSYSESRTPSVPAFLLELLSHQNFADMKYGLDPTFRFTVARSVYKGMLKFLSNRYGFSYEVQPLPVNSFSAVLESDNIAKLSWKATADTLETTAVPKGYILQTRIDDGVFDEGRILDSGDRCWTSVPIEKGHIYSFRITAFNEGGKSFPSEVLAVGIPERAHNENVLIVNNFTRVSAPSWFDYPEYAGFDTRIDGGVPFGYEINYVGDQFEFRRKIPWLDDDNPGWGGSFTDMAGKKIAGNTFDFVAVHGKALMAAGYSFSSASEAAFEENPSLGNAWALDLLCGKQITTPVGRGGDVPDRFKVFPEGLRKGISDFTSKGGNVLISGANIGTDLWDQIYPVVAPDSVYTAEGQAFVQEVLGYTWLTNHPTRSGEVRAMKSSMIETDGLRKPFSFNRDRTAGIYAVESPDGLMPASDKSSIFLRYTDTNVSAGVCFDSGTYKTVSLGFPLETVLDEKELLSLMKASLDFFR